MSKVFTRIGVALVAVIVVVALGTWYATSRSGEDEAGSPSRPTPSASSAGSQAAPAEPEPEPAPTSAAADSGAVAKETATRTKSTPPPKVAAMHFPRTSATVGSKDRAKLKKLAEKLQHHPSWRVAITGHADDIGDGHSNVILSRQRAESTAVVLRQLGVNSSRVVSDWKSSDEPIATNDTEKGRAANRRVEFALSEAKS